MNAGERLEVRAATPRRCVPKTQNPLGPAVFLCGRIQNSFVVSTVKGRGALEPALEQAQARKRLSVSALSLARLVSAVFIFLQKVVDRELQDRRHSR